MSQSSRHRQGSRRTGGRVRGRGRGLQVSEARHCVERVGEGAAEFVPDENTANTTLCQHYFVSTLLWCLHFLVTRANWYNIT